ncbi:MAG TPA: glycosyltransferase [Bacteroidetes bacterium]|nr:glycosyltransferase [Bacteroidota bacterium]
MNETLDIILPCFNPINDWAEKVIEAVNVIQKGLPNTAIHIILVNDGSSTGVSENDIELLSQKLNSFQYIPSSPNMGKGFALRRGVAAAKSNYQIYTDIDFPYQENSLLHLFSILQAGKSDIVVGVRDNAYYEGVPPTRKRISRILRWMLRTFLRLKITDTQCGLKGFNSKGKLLFMQTTINRFLFDLEFVFLASHEKSLLLTPADVSLKPGVIFSKVNWRILLIEGFNFLKIFLRGIWKRFF